MTKTNQLDCKVATRTLAAQRRQQTLALRVAGATELEISRVVGITPGRVHQILDGELARLAHETRADAVKWRAVLVARYELVVKTLHTRVLQGDVVAIDRYLRALQQEALLLGLAQAEVESEAITRIEVVDALPARDGLPSGTPFMVLTPIASAPGAERPRPIILDVDNNGAVVDQEPS